MEKKQVLGKGACGIVFKETYDGEDVAVKLITKQRHNEESVLLKLGAHPNIVPFYGSFEKNQKYYLVFGLCERIRKRMELTDVKQVGRHVLRAMRHCHNQGYRHGDIKRANIMIFNRRYVLIDFGYCTKESDATGMGTVDYFAPELCCRSPDLIKENDIWALGVVLFQLLTGCTPFEEDSISKTKSNIRKVMIVNKDEWEGLDDTGKDFFGMIFLKNPSKRATSDELLNHPWLQK